MRLSKIHEVLLFHLLINIVFVFFVTGASYYHIPLRGLKDNLIYIVHLCLLQTTVAGVIYLLSLNRLIFKTLFSLLFFTLGTLSFWVYSIDLTIGKELIDASKQSKYYIIQDLISWQFLLYGLLLLSFNFVILKYYSKIAHKEGRKYFQIFAVACISLFFIAEKKRPDTFIGKLPYNFFNSILSNHQSSIKTLSKPENIQYKKDSSNLKVIFVIGESVRPDHLGINGYQRNTTPLLSKRANLLSKTIFTHKTYTAASLEQMLTNLSIYEDSIPKLYSIFDVLKQAQIHTSWIGNQLLENDYSTIAKSTDTTLIIDELKSSLSYHKAKDEKLLPFIKKELTRPYTKQLLTTHMIGSHWWYESRYPNNFQKFLPIIDSKYMPSLTQEQVINSYDNTILYTDFFIDQIITQLETITTPTMLLFVSDHGEALGENGKWLHAFESPEVKKTSLIIWYSQSYKKAYPEKVQALKSQYDSSITMDVIFYTLQDLFNITNQNIHLSILRCED